MGKGWKRDGGDRGEAGDARIEPGARRCRVAAHAPLRARLGRIKLP